MFVPQPKKNTNIWCVELFDMSQAPFPDMLGHGLHNGDPQYRARQG